MKIPTLILFIAVFSVSTNSCLQKAKRSFEVKDATGGITDAAGLRKPLCIYNNWSVYDELSDNIPLSEELTMRQLQEILRLRRYGVTFDYYTMDAFWFDLESGYRSWRKEYWPNGPDKWIKACQENGLTPGLWFGVNNIHLGGFNTLKVIPEWEDSVSEDGKTLCLFRGGYLNHFMETLQLYADMGIRLFKFDFANFGAATAADKKLFTYEEIAEKNITAFINALRSFREKNPDVIIIAYNGFGGDIHDTVTPFRQSVDHRWLEVFDTMYSGDPRVSDVPMMNFWRSVDLYPDQMVRQYLFSGIPIQRIDNCAFMIGKTGTCYNRALQAWKGMLVLLMARGGWMNVYHGNLELLDDANAAWFGKAQQFFLNIQRHATTNPFGGIPGKVQPYGWQSIFPSEKSSFTAVYTVVNPSQETKEIVLPTAKGKGRILFTDAGFTPILKQQSITLGAEQMAVVGYGDYNNAVYDLGIEEDVSIPASIEEITRYKLSHTGQQTAQISISPEKKENIRILIQQRNENGHVFRSSGGGPPDGTFMSEFFHIQASHNGKSLPLLLNYNKQIWSGLSWAVAEIPANQFEKNDTLNITITLREGKTESMDLHLYSVSYVSDSAMNSFPK